MMNIFSRQWQHHFMTQHVALYQKGLQHDVFFRADSFGPNTRVQSIKYLNNVIESGKCFTFRPGARAEALGSK